MKQQITTPHYINAKGEAYCQYCLEGTVEGCEADYELREREYGECFNCHGDHTPIDRDYYIADGFVGANLETRARIAYIKKLARAFENLGGMGTDTPEAHAAHQKLADAVDNAPDYNAAYAAAAAIVDSFDY